MNPNTVLWDWKHRQLSVGEIKKRHNLTREQVYAICEHSNSLYGFEIIERLGNLWSGESAANIKTGMSYRWSFIENVRITKAQIVLAARLRELRILRIAFCQVKFTVRSLFFESAMMKCILTFLILLGCIQ